MLYVLQYYDNITYTYKIYCLFLKLQRKGPRTIPEETNIEI